MPLEKKNVSFPFLKGRNAKPSKKSQPIGEMEEVQDLQCTRTGQLEARKGYLREGNTVPAIADVQGASTVSSGKVLIQSDQETLILNGRESYTKGKDDVWIDRGDVVACEYDESLIESTPMGTATKASYASVNGYDVYVWVEQSYDVLDVSSVSGNETADNVRLADPAMYYKIMGRDTGAVIVPKTKIEDMVTQLRCGGDWKVNGGQNAAGDRTRGPIEEKTTSVATADKEVANGNLIVMKEETTGLQETFPCQSLSGETLSGDSIPTSGWLWSKYVSLSGESVFCDITKGANSNYYQMKPQLFAYPDSNAICLVYANGTNPASVNSSGFWSVRTRTIMLDSTVGSWTSSSQLQTFNYDPGDLSPAVNIQMDRQAPVWDADILYDTSDSPNGGFCVIHVTPQQSNSYNEAGSTTLWDTSSVLVTTYSCDVSVGVLVVTPKRVRDLTADNAPGVKVGTDRLTTKQGATASQYEIWSPDASLISFSTYPDEQPVTCPVQIRGLNKRDITGNNKLVASSDNRILYFVDNDGKATGITTVGIHVGDLTSQAAPAGGGGTYRIRTIFEAGVNADYEDIVAEGMFLVDVAVAQPTDPAYTGGDASIMGVMQVTKPSTGLFFSRHYGPDPTYTWLLKVDLGSLDSAPTVSPPILFRNVDLVSDGFRDYEATVQRSYYCVTSVGVPQDNSDTDDSGRICIIDWNGRLVSAWKPLIYATGCDSQWFSTGDLSKKQNNFQARGLRSRVCYDDNIPLSNMEFGSNNYDNGIYERKYKWMLPTHAKFVLDPPSPLQNTSSEGAVYVASGLLWRYAGSKFTENEFLHGPHVAYTGASTTAHRSVVFAGGSGTYTETFTDEGGLQEGNYSYYFNYFWRDDNGDTHTSDATRLFQEGLYVSANHATANFRIQGLQLTNHKDFAQGVGSSREPGEGGYPIDASIQIWRTAKDANSGAPRIVGLVPMTGNKRFYEFEDDPVFLEGYTPGFSVNDPAQAELLNPPIPFLEPVPRYHPTCPVSVTQHMGHIIVASSDNTIWSSLSLVPLQAAGFTSGGTEASTNQFMFTPDITERYTHVESSGNILYVFSGNNVYAYAGPGPDMSRQGQFQGPELVAPSMGIRPTGFAKKIPDGVIYQSQKGYYLLQGAKRPTYFGAAVRDYEQETPIGSAVSDRDQHILIGLGGSNQKVLVYNWEFQLWSVWDFSQTNSIGDLASMSSWVDESGTYSLDVLAADGYLWTQKTRTSTEPWKDTGAAGVSVAPKIVTGWIQFPQFHKSFRMYRSNLLWTVDTEMGRSGTWTIKTRTDWDTTVRSTHTDAFTVTSLSQEPLETVVRPTRQKCKSFQMEVTLATTASGEEPAMLEGVAFLIGDRKAKQAFDVDTDMESTVT